MTIIVVRAVPTLLLIVYKIHLAASSRGEASLESSDSSSVDLSEGLAGTVLTEHCEEAVHRSRSASETIQALQNCIKDLEKYSSQSRNAHSAATRGSKTYADDVNILGSFLQSLQAKLAKTYEKHKKQYNSLRDDQHQVVSGFLQKLGTLPMQALKGGDTPHKAHVSAHRDGNPKRAPSTSALQQAKQGPARKAKKLEQALRQVAQRKQRRPHRQQAPSLLQLSSQDGEVSPRDEEFERSPRHGPNPTSLLQLAADSSSADAGKAQAPAHAPTSLLEQEVSSFANLFWKPWKPLAQGGQPALQNIVGIGFTKDDVEARTAVLDEGGVEEKVESAIEVR